MSNKSFCEKTKWSYMEQPMNTLSSLSFLVTAYMLRDIHDCFHFTWMLVLLTISTMLMHGSGSYFWGM